MSLHHRIDLAFRRWGTTSFGRPVGAPPDRLVATSLRRLVAGLFGGYSVQATYRPYCADAVRFKNPAGRAQRARPNPGKSRVWRVSSSCRYITGSIWRSDDGGLHRSVARSARRLIAWWLRRYDASSLGCLVVTAFRRPIARTARTLCDSRTLQDAHNVLDPAPRQRPRRGSWSGPAYVMACPRARVLEGAVLRHIGPEPGQRGEGGQSGRSEVQSWRSGQRTALLQGPGGRVRPSLDQVQDHRHRLLGRVRLADVGGAGSYRVVRRTPHQSAPSPSTLRGAGGSVAGRVPPGAAARGVVDEGRATGARRPAGPATPAVGGEQVLGLVRWDPPTSFLARRRHLSRRTRPTCATNDAVASLAAPDRPPRRQPSSFVRYCMRPSVRP